MLKIEKDKNLDLIAQALKSLHALLNWMLTVEISLFEATCRV